MHSTVHTLVYKNAVTFYTWRNFVCWACAPQGIHCLRVTTEELKIHMSMHFSTGE